jgi:phosphonate transport system permease protein
MFSDSSSIRRTVFDALSLSFLLGIALIFAVRPGDEQMLDMRTNGLVFLGLFLFSAVVSFLLIQNGQRTLGEHIFEPDHKKGKQIAAPWYKSIWGWQLAILLVVTFGVGLVKTRFSIEELLDEGGFQGAVNLFNGLAHPNLALLPKAILNIIETIFMAFMATFLAIPFAFILSFFCAKNIMKGPFLFSIYLFLRTVLNVTRSVEALIWAIIFSVWVGIGPFAGMLALMVHSVASLAKQYSEMVEAVSEGPIEGVLATGATQLQTIWYAIVPQVVLPYVSFTMYRWDINVRMATVIGLVGGGGIGTMLVTYQGQGLWPEVGCIVMVIAVVVWILDQSSAVLRSALK